jgi:NAD(P)H-hydrate epimerase
MQSRWVTVGASRASAIDKELLSDEWRFDLGQLVESAGKACFDAITSIYTRGSTPHVLVVAGKGNNGSDALVVARMLAIAGHQVQILCAAGQPTRAMDERLLFQALKCGCTLAKDLSQVTGQQTPLPDLVVDGLFGFSFDTARGLAEPYKSIVTYMAAESKNVCSIDVPSGWNVDAGDVLDTKLMPAVLVSMTLPKKCSEHFSGRHLLGGGQFIPPAVLKVEERAFFERVFHQSSSSTMLDRVPPSFVELTLAPEQHMKDEPIVFLCTVPGVDRKSAADGEEGGCFSLAEFVGGMLEEGIVACVNVQSQVQSHYKWEGKVCVDQERLLVIKTTTGRSQDLKTYVEAKHPYACPEVLALGVDANCSSRRYLDWVHSSL